MTKWIIDSDAGADDALAFLLAFGNNLDVIAITTVTGNVYEPVCYKNLCELLRVCDKDIPIYRGATRPLINQPNPDFFYSEDGFNGYWSTRHQLFFPEETSEKAPNAIVRLSKEHEDLGVICLGPLTNLATAYLIDSTLQISSIYMMGGTIDGKGNSTSVAEFNVYYDPEAAFIVFDRTPDIFIVPWETAFNKELCFSEEKYAEMLCDNKKGEFFQAAIKTDGYLCDAIVIACILDPSLVIATERMHVTVELAGNYTRGQTIVHRNSKSLANPDLKKFTLVRTVDSNKVFDLLKSGIYS